MKYRADIDGLRAIAVALVVLFHARFAFIPGGYIGVDVFFVISGFLITLILRQNILGQKFSIKEFYLRRIRRIFPAAFFVLLCTTLVSSFILMPKEFKELGSSLASCLLYLSNIYFWRHTGYFDSAGELSPLLHTWSLAVEEQFYLFVPLFLYFVMRGNKDPRRWIWLLFAASLISNVIVVRLSPATAFFFPFTRAWELFAGSILAFANRPYFADARRAELAGVLGIALIAGPGFLYDGQTRFPGEAAILPVLGAVLVIAAGADHVTRVSAWLSNRYVVAIGRISFSLYLWHWPVFVLMRYLNLGELDNSETGIALLLTVVLSILSYRWIEVPFRRPDGTWGSQRKVFAGAALATAVLLVVAGGISLGGGLPQRFDLRTRVFAMGAFDINPRRRECDTRSPTRVLADDICRLGAPDGVPTFALLGDSFGDALVPGVDAVARAEQRQGLILTMAGCYPLVGLNMPDGNACRLFVDAAIKRINEDPSIDTVILVGRWSTAVLGTRYGYGAGPSWFIADDQTTGALGPEENLQVLRRGLQRTLSALHSKRIFIVAYVPEQKVFVPQAAALSQLLKRDEPVGVSRAIFDLRQRKVHDWLDEGARLGAYTVLDVGALLCNVDHCAATRDGKSLYSDDNHLSGTGAKYIGSIIAPALARRVKPASADLHEQKSIQ
jgi:peptidoglycan/LPS O-acetylase OafA/YrhL